MPIGTLSRRIDWMELEFPLKFDALALQFKSDILQNWFNNREIQAYSTQLFSNTESTCLKYNGDNFGRVQYHMNIWSCVAFL